MKEGLSDILPRTKIITVGGGKGGVGKSIVASGIAGELARLGRKVILLDADLGGANLHLTMGVRYPERTLNDFILGTFPDIHDILLKTPLKNVSLISGASGIYELTNPRFIHKQKLVSSFLKLKADYLIVDVGAGAAGDNTDFFFLSDHGIVVITNEPTSVENAYGFLKNGLVRKMHALFAANGAVKEILTRYANPQRHGFHRLGQIADKIAEADPNAGRQARSLLNKCRPRLVVNMARSARDVAVHESFKRIAAKYLDIEMAYVGYLVYDETVKKSVRQMIPITTFGDSEVVGCLNAVTRNIIALEENGHGRA